MARFNISMERINNDYSRVISISEENETFKSELYGLYESQEGIRKDLRLANEALDYARKRCKQAKNHIRTVKFQKISILNTVKKLKRVKI